MIKYVIVEEKAETRTTDVVNEAMDDGLQNGYYNVLAEVETIEEAWKLYWICRRFHIKRNGR